LDFPREGDSAPIKTLMRDVKLAADRDTRIDKLVTMRTLAGMPSARAAALMDELAGLGSGDDEEGGRTVAHLLLGLAIPSEGGIPSCGKLAEAFSQRISPGTAPGYPVLPVAHEACIRALSELVASCPSREAVEALAAGEMPPKEATGSRIVERLLTSVPSFAARELVVKDFAARYLRDIDFDPESTGNLAVRSVHLRKEAGRELQGVERWRPRRVPEDEPVSVLCFQSESFFFDSCPRKKKDPTNC
jgi:hypothetical protein